MKGGGGMKQWEIGHPTSLVRLTVNLTDRFAGEELRHRKATESNHDFRFDNLNLPLQERIAGGNLGRLRIPIVRRSTLHNVGNKNVRTRETNGRQELGEKLTGGADKGTALLVFVVPRALANEQNLRARRTLPRDSLVSSLGKRARGTSGDLRRD